jgi:hypothetical protein
VGGLRVADVSVCVCALKLALTSCCLNLVYQFLVSVCFEIGTDVLLFEFDKALKGSNTVSPTIVWAGYVWVMHLITKI